MTVKGTEFAIFGSFDLNNDDLGQSEGAQNIVGLLPIAQSMVETPGIVADQDTFINDWATKINALPAQSGTASDPNIEQSSEQESAIASLYHGGENFYINLQAGRLKDTSINQTSYAQGSSINEALILTNPNDLATNGLFASGDMDINAHFNEQRSTSTSDLYNLHFGFGIGDKNGQLSMGAYRTDIEARDQELDLTLLRDFDVPGPNAIPTSHNLYGRNLSSTSMTETVNDGFWLRLDDLGRFSVEASYGDGTETVTDLGTQGSEFSGPVGMFNPAVGTVTDLTTAAGTPQVTDYNQLGLVAAYDLLHANENSSFKLWARYVDREETPQGGATVDLPVEESIGASFTAASHKFFINGHAEAVVERVPGTQSNNLNFGQLYGIFNADGLVGQGLALASSDDLQGEVRLGWKTENSVDRRDVVAYYNRRNANSRSTIDRNIKFAMNADEDRRFRQHVQNGFMGSVIFNTQTGFGLDVGTSSKGAGFGLSLRHRPEGFAELAPGVVDSDLTAATLTSHFKMGNNLSAYVGIGATHNKIAGQDAILDAGLLAGFQAWFA